MNEIVRKEDSPTKGAWVVERDGKRLAEMTYSVAGSDKIIIDTKNGQSVVPFLSLDQMLRKEEKK